MTPSLHQACDAFKKSYAETLHDHPEDVRAVDEMDELIHEVRAILGHAAMKITLEGGVAVGGEADRSCECGGRSRIERRPGIEVHSMQGDHPVQGVALRCGQCGKLRWPIHEVLGVQGQHHTTVLFERLSSDFFLDKGSPGATRRLKEHHGLEVGRTKVLQHAEERGADARTFIEEKLERASKESEARRGKSPRIDEVFTQMDSSSGKTVKKLIRPVVPEDAQVERTPVRGLVKVQRPIEGRQVKLLCAQAKGEATWAYHGYIGEFEEAVVPLQHLAATRGWQEGVRAIMTADGEDKIREMAQGAFLPNLQFILDHPHAIGHLGQVPQHAGQGLPLPKDQWLKQATDLLHQGRVRELIPQIEEVAAHSPPGDDRKKVNNVATYFDKRAGATHYDAFKARGWPIASGTVEGGHRAFMHPITKRGSGWIVDNLNGTVALACVRQNDWWEEFWPWVQDRRRPPAALKKAA
jgi:hypothetical protein